MAYAGGAMIGSEARASGFNVMLGGSINLMREPRNGRNFEYAGEDPLLAGSMVGALIAGIQSNQIISTTKHYALNDQETGRNGGDFVIDQGALRMSDLLAFQIAIERGNPGSVMCAYNKVGGTYACENHWLLTDVLRKDWGWPGYVMSDWGAAHSTVASVRCRARPGIGLRPAARRMVRRGQAEGGARRGRDRRRSDRHDGIADPAHDVRPWPDRRPGCGK